MNIWTILANSRLESCGRSLSYKNVPSTGETEYGEFSQPTYRSPRCEIVLHISSCCLPVDNVDGPERRLRG